MTADAVRLARRVDRARTRRVPSAEWERIAADLARSIERAQARAAAKPRIRLSARAAGRAARRGDRARHPRAPGGDRVRRDGLRQDHAAAQDLPRGRARRTRPDRPHAAAAHRRARGGHAHRARDGRERGRVRRLQGPLHRPHAAGRLRQDHDRRHPARRDAGRPRSRRLRHDHRRRGARAQPQHRLPARLPEAAARAPTRPQGDRDVRHARRRPLRAALRHGGRAGAGDRGLGPHVPGRDPLSAARGQRGRRRDGYRARGRRRGSAGGSDRRRRRGPVARRAGRHPRVPARRARDPRDRATCCAAALARRPYAQDVEILPLFARLSIADQQRVFARQPRAAHRARDQRRRDVAHRAGHPLRDRRGLARVKRYSVRNKTTLLQIEKVSQAAAQQRAGRCGRVQDGICVRLYSEEDFARPAALHRARDPALVAGLRDPAHGRARAARRRRIPVPRSADRARDHRRLPAAAGARRRRCRPRADAARPRARAAAARSAHRAHRARRSRSAAACRRRW